jgi:hypothetical protein
MFEFYFIGFIVILCLSILLVSLITYFNEPSKPEPIPPTPPIPPEPTKDVLVAVGSPQTPDFNNTLAYSTDNGTTWIGLGTDIFSDFGTSVFWYKGKWVATGQGSNSLAYSNDGINWTPSESGNAIFTQYGTSVYHNGVKWLAIGSGVDNLAVSDDGENWVGKSSLNDLEFVFPSNSVYANQGRFFVTNIGNSNRNKLYYSNDNGETWNNIQVNNNSNFKIYCNENKCLISGPNFPSNNTKISYNNGETWSDEIPIFDDRTLGLYYSSNKWLMSIYNDNNLKISYDNGQNWSNSITVNTNIIYGFYESQNRWFSFGAGNSNGNIFYSEDLTNWTQSPQIMADTTSIY